MALAEFLKPLNTMVKGLEAHGHHPVGDAGDAMRRGEIPCTANDIPPPQAPYAPERILSRGVQAFRCNAQVSITLDIYTHYIPDDDEDIAANWGKRFSGLIAPE
jgi:hypothetical protein